MISKKIVPLEAGLPDMVRLEMMHGQNKDLIFYCYKSGADITADYYRQQWNIVANQLTKKSTASAMIRFSSRIVDNEANTEKRIIAFIREMMPEIESTLVD